MLAAVLCLGAATWWLTGVEERRESVAAVARAQHQVQLRLDDFANNVDELTDGVQSASLLVAREGVVSNALTGAADVNEANGFLAFLAETMHVNTAFVLNAAGECVAANDPRLVGQTFGDDLFAAALNGGNGVQYLVDPGAGAPGLSYANRYSTMDGCWVRPSCAPPFPTSPGSRPRGARSSPTPMAW